MSQEEIENLLNIERLNLASTSKRATAFFLDELLLSLLLVVALWNSFAEATTMEELINLSNSFALDYIVLKIIYQGFFVYKYGATLGKTAMRIRVVELKTMSNPVLPSSINRAIFRIVSEMFFYLGFLWGMLDPLKRAWHDLSAKTLVVEN